MKISASLFSKKSEWVTYANQLEYTGVDYIHIDYVDGENAPVKISMLTSKMSRIPYDVHIIAPELKEATIKELNGTATAYLCVQYENLLNKEDLEKLNWFNGHHGISFTIETPIEVLESYIEKSDFILIMCSKPGVSGATFDEGNIERIRYLREKYPALPIHVDGGIDDKRIAVMENLGVSLCVSGSYLASTDGMSLIRRVCELKFRDPNVRVADIMTLRKNLSPIAVHRDFFQLLQNINDSQSGTAFVEDDKGEFVGIITDGDVRRTILNEKKRVFSLLVRDIVNRGPYCVKRSNRLAEVFLERMLLQKNVMVIPVVEDGILVGAIDLKKYF